MIYLAEIIAKKTAEIEAAGLCKWKYRKPGTGDGAVAEDDMESLSITRAAQAAHEANRVLCLALGDTSQPKWEDAPDWQKTSAEKGVEMILNNPETTPEQSHEGWLEVKRADGWKYGPVKNPETKEHPCFLPYAQLPENQRLKDEMFGLVVRAVLAL
jgi:hypothetical protein